ncbi:MAG: gliding motility lipoprotein GldD [Flavobacteriales bacterium]|nr:gliding motility lipoprotein GldD [Flavobacteriales bacterium]
MKRLKGWLVSFFLVIIITGCVDDSKDIPKPMGYFRIEFPDHEYEMYSDPVCPFTFEKPKNALLVDSDQNQCFKSLIYPHLKAGVYFTYFPVNDNIDKLINTADDIVYEHHNMASGIETKDVIFPEKNVYGISYKLMGDVAVNHVFFVTDSNNHYFAGKLYFESIPNYDSLQPCVDYIVEDIEHILNTIQWQLPMSVNQIDQ